MNTRRTWKLKPKRKMIDTGMPTIRNQCQLHGSGSQWGKTVTLNCENFSPVNLVGVRNAGTTDDDIDDIFSPFVDDSLLQILVDMTNLRAAQHKVSIPNDYCARH